ncbi:small heat shock protein [Amylocystis lapponica]|nr:small heat shock protein [Amylocystis lapponica]
MSLSTVFYEPFYSLADFDRLFDEAFSARTSQPSSNGELQRQDNFSTARMDVRENAQTNTVTATFELPGLSKENVQIDVHNGVLSVSGESKTASDRDNNGYVVRERRYGKFSRAIPLPQGIKHEDIKAAMDNGVLTITFPKTTPEMAPKKITVS